MTHALALPMPSAVGNLDAYIQAANRFPMLTEAEESSLARRFRDEVGEFGIDIVGEIVAQFFDVDAAGLHHGHGVLVLRQGEQEMFERRKLLTALSGVGERTMQGLLKGTRKCRQGCVLSPGRVSLFPLTVNVQAGLKVAM